MKKLVLGLGVLVVLAVGAYFLFFSKGPSDEQLIREALQRSLDASRRGEPGGVTDLLSRQLEVNDEHTPSLRQVADFIRKQKPKIVIENQKPLISEKEARIVSPAQVTFSFPGRTFDVRLKEVTLIFQKEDTLRYFVIPEKAWKLSKVYVDESALPMDQFDSFGSFGGFGGF